MQNRAAKSVSLRLAAAVALASIAGGATAAPAPSPPTPPPAAGPAVGQPINIDRNGVLILIRSTLLAVDQANRTGNYTVLRDLGAPAFQAANSAARLGDIFANLRNQNLDLSGIAVLEPQLTMLPSAGPNGQMRMAGFFPSVPLQINFELIYVPVEGRWKLFGIGINLGQASPAAPPDPAPPPADPKGADAGPAPHPNPPGRTKPTRPGSDGR